MTIILVHGRGSSANDMISLYKMLDTDGIAAVAPQAAGGTWYPQSFLSPLAANQPHLDSALRRLAAVLDDIRSRGVSSDRVAILGFSQGACLATEFAVRHPQRFGAIIGLTGGLIGPPGTPRDYDGSLAGTPVFLGRSDPDPHVPFARVLETEAVLTRMNAKVELRRYPGMPHTVNNDELLACRLLLQQIASSAQAKGASA